MRRRTGEHQRKAEGGGCQRHCLSSSRRALKTADGSPSSPGRHVVQAPVLPFSRPPPLSAHHPFRLCGFVGLASPYCSFEADALTPLRDRREGTKSQCSDHCNLCGSRPRSLKLALIDHGCAGRRELDAGNLYFRLCMGCVSLPVSCVITPAGASFQVLVEMQNLVRPFEWE